MSDKPKPVPAPKPDVEPFDVWWARMHDEIGTTTTSSADGW